ncbi:hypothetical protein ACOMHN_004473 [Nucella lapillus]
MNCSDDLEEAPEDSMLAVQQLVISAVIVTCFIATKTLLDNLRRRQARMTVVVIGAGPIGLTSLMMAAQSGRVSRVILFEEQGKMALFHKPHQIAFEAKSVAFLRRFGVDFDNMEGCSDNGCFFTRLGVFLEYMLSVVCRLPVPVEVRLGVKDQERKKSDKRIVKRGEEDQERKKSDKRIVKRGEEDQERKKSDKRIVKRGEEDQERKKSDKRIVKRGEEDQERKKSDKRIVKRGEEDQERKKSDKRIVKRGEEDQERKKSDKRIVKRGEEGQERKKSDKRIVKRRGSRTEKI